MRSLDLPRRAVRLGLLMMWPATAAFGQSHPGLSAQPSGRALDGTDLAPELPGINLSRPESRPPTFEPSMDEETFLGPALRGEAWAQTRLGKHYVTTGGDEMRTQRGIDLLQAAAEQNDAEAIYLLATMTAAGAGLEQSDVDAFEQMQRAADLGFVDAQFALGTMYFSGRGTAQNEAAAVDAFRRAADGGHREAMFAGGRILLSKTDPETRAEGLTLMNRAIENGHAGATVMLATAYGRGSLGMPKDEVKAEALLTTGAERGDADCQMALASLYQFGDSFATRRDEAQVWLQRAANQGHAKALEILGAESEEMQRPAGPAGPTE